MHEVVKRLKTIISQSNAIYQQQNDNLSNQIDEKASLNNIEASSHGELSQLIKNFHNMNANKIESVISTNESIISESISSNNLSKVVKEIIAFITKVINKGIEQKFMKQHTLDYFT